MSKWVNAMTTQFQGIKNIIPKSRVDPIFQIIIDCSSLKQYPKTVCTQKFDLSLILLSQSLKLFVADEQSGRHADIVLHDGKNSYKKKQIRSSVCQRRRPQRDKWMVLAKNFCSMNNKTALVSRKFLVNPSNHLGGVTYVND